MAYEITFLPSAVKELAALPKKPREKLAEKIDALGDEPRPPYPRSKALKGAGKGLHRIRHGNYRAIYRVDDDEVVVCVVKVADRKSVYRQL